MKKTVIFLYVVVVAVMAAATIVEKYEGTRFVADHIYGAWWFSLLWGLLTAVAVCWLVKRRVRRFSTVLLHLSFVVILLGALITHLTARHGALHLREGETAATYVADDLRVLPLPFNVRLDRFEVTYHQGTTTPADFTSHLALIDPAAAGHKSHAAAVTSVSVSMNRIASHHGIRLYQSGYDPDGHGTILAVNSDPWGIPVTYCGYALLFFALVWLLIDPHGTYRRLLRSPMLRCCVLCAGCWLGHSGSAAAAPQAALPTLPRETAAHLGRLNMLMGDRIGPVGTYALDFTKKLHGRRSYRGYSAEQVFAGFLFWPEAWRQEPLVKVKGGVKDRLQLPAYCSVATFFNEAMGGYILGPHVEAYYQGQQDAFHKDVAKMDDRLMIVMELGQGSPLRLFPFTTPHGVTTWYAPTDKLSADIPSSTQHFIRHLFTLMAEEARNGRYDRVDSIITKLGHYQLQQGGTSIPSPHRLRAEYLYNRVPFATWLFMLNLTMGLLSLAFFIVTLRRRQRLAAPPRTRRFPRLVPRLSLGVFLLSFTVLTAGLVLRWIITGHVPMSNGYETMLTLAWLVMAFSLSAYRRFSIVLSFGFLLSGFFLLASHIGQMDPQIGHLMPVLDSPLLSLHVSIIMMAFALLSLTFICGVTALLLPVLQEELQLLSRLMLYPALTTLGLGIFIGALWANVSWGTYWSWDPKETWALITFMVYAVVVHTQSLPVFSRPLAYHVYMTVAFLTILMTYFGVNYFLGGMHSYA